MIETRDLTKKYGDMFAIQSIELVSSPSVVDVFAGAVVRLLPKRPFARERMQLLFHYTSPLVQDSVIVNGFDSSYCTTAILVVVTTSRSGPSTRTTATPIACTTSRASVALA